MSELSTNEITRKEIIAMMRLTDKQKIMCEEFVKHFDKLLAAKRAGYAFKDRGRGGYQDKNIKKSVDRLFESKAVQGYIRILKTSVGTRLNLSMDDIVEELKAMAFAKMTDYIKWGNDGIVFVKSSDELTEQQQKGVLEVTSTETRLGTQMKVKMTGKQAALDRLYEILKELSEAEDQRPKPAAAKVSISQINVMLQNPVKRRAIEHIAEAMFDAKIHLDMDDKDRREFERMMDRIQGDFLEASRGSIAGYIEGGSGVGAPVEGAKGQVAGSRAGGSAELSGGEGKVESSVEEGGGTDKSHGGKPKRAGKQGASADGGDESDEELSRYAFDGL